MKTPSIRYSLLIRCGLGVGLLMILLSLFIYFMIRKGLYDELDESITQTASILANQVEFEHGEIIFEWEEGIGTNTAISDQALFQYWNERTGRITRSPALGNGDLPKFSGPGGLPDIEHIRMPGSGRHARAIGMIVYPYMLPEEEAFLRSEGKTFDAAAYPHTLVVARETEQLREILSHLYVALITGNLLTLAVGFLLINSVIRHALRPIDQLADEVKNRAENQLDAAISLPRELPQELRSLAISFDSLLTRVSAIRDRERDFIRHASHELRTPIASLSAITELALSKERESQAYRKHLENCSKVAAELNELVKRLSALARVGQLDAAQKAEACEILPLLEACLEKFRGRAEAAELTVSIKEFSGPLRVLADPVLIQLIFNNLLDNAICYAPGKSEIDISITMEKECAEITFCNIAEDLPEDLDRLFEPLFRRDASRQESMNPHLGIGLTLSQNAAQAMSGSLRATRPADHLISFTLSLPLAG
ncbi:sensor histidine kinase [Luteolibacter algae]|uniref:histidine kinase n=1 Tax=Luteolibacter algae TaxID=454151 RepID=A0ABW5DA60_9BACT